MKFGSPICFLSILPLFIGPFTAASGFAPQSWARQSKLFHLINIQTGPDEDQVPIPQPEKVPLSAIDQAPNNSVVMLGFSDGKHAFICTGIVAYSSPRFQAIVAAGHCPAKFGPHDHPLKDNAGKMILEPHAYVFTGVRGSNYREKRTLGRPCVLGTNRPYHDLNHDYSVYIVKPPLKGLVPLLLKPSSELPPHCSDHLDERMYMGGQNRLHQVTNCRRQIGYETIFDEQRSTNVRVTDCASSYGSSGAPLFCSDHSGKRYLYAMQTFGNTPDGVYRVLKNVHQSIDNVNVAIPVDDLIRAVNQCVNRQ